MSRSRSRSARSRSRSPAGRLADTGPKDPVPNCVFIHNLPSDFTDKDVAKFMKHYKMRPALIKMLMTKGGKPKGMCTVEFDTEAEMKECVDELDQKECEGRTIAVREDRGEGYISPETKGKKGKGKKSKGKGYYRDSYYRRDSRPRGRSRRDSRDRGYGKGSYGKSDRGYSSKGYRGDSRGRKGYGKESRSYDRDYDRGYERKSYGKDRDYDRGYERRESKGKGYGKRSDSRRRY